MGNQALPSYGNQIDVYHEGKLNDVIILEESGSPTAITLIVWEAVADTDQRALIKLFNQYGFPATATAGRHSVKLNTQQFVGSPHPTGLKSKQYSVTVAVTGPGSPNSSTEQSVTINGSSAQTFPQLAAALATAIIDVDVTFTGNALRFSTTATGSNARVEVKQFGTLFNPASPLLGFNGFGNQLVGVGSTREVLELNRNSSNVLFSDRYSFIVRKRRPYLNRPFKFRTEYFDSGSNSLGSPMVGQWRLLGTNQLAGSPDTVPSWLLP